METILTGVKPTGIVHIGNYFGAIKPAIDLMNSSNAKFYFFVADYHAMTTIQSAELMKEYTYQIASTWLACGLDPSKVCFYRQSDVSEIFEFSTILTNFAPKGLLNRAHAYKAHVEENTKKGLDSDEGVNMGLFGYPVLMAADILLFNATKVPVGLDQKQHVEITRDIAKSFNSKMGKTLIVPTELINKEVATIVGLDGRKMSKSYNNTIKLFASESELLSSIKKIVTDSRLPGEPKDINNTIYTIYKLFATAEECKSFEKDLLDGIGWGDAKIKLFELANKKLQPMRKKYEYYINNPMEVDRILEEGALKARPTAKETLHRVKCAIGINKTKL